MKLSLNLQDDPQIQNPLLKAKLPISIFNQPFTSIFTTTTTNSFSDSTCALSTNFPSGPSLKLTYTPSTTTTTPGSPLSLSLKSGLGLFGSPRNSPLVFSAHFSLCKSSTNVIVPTFSLQFKPNFGHFSLHKRTTSPSSNPNYDPSGSYTNGPHLESGSPSKSQLGNGFASDGSPGWQELKLEPCNGKGKDGFANRDYIDDVYVGNNGIGFFAREAIGLEGWKERRVF
ncbi:hypothetical protein OIU78_010200 [Salix suchowensis]|nr:hypothetical protein OIU78_010200 [Salix suchowensis]